MSCSMGGVISSSSWGGGKGMVEVTQYGQSQAGEELEETHLLWR